MRITFALLTAFAAAVSAGPCRSRTSSSTLATSVSTEMATSSESSAVVSSVATTFTSTAEPAETSTTTTTTEPSTTSAISDPNPTVFNFCLTAVTGDAPNYRQLVHVVRPDSDLAISIPNNPMYPSMLGHFNLDISTGALTLNNTVYPGYQVHMYATVENQVAHAIRISTAPAANALSCSNPDGQYTSGSILKCSVTKEESTGPKMFNAFASLSTTTVSVWQIILDGYQRPDLYEYDVAMFFGDDCSFSK